jgi:hypothetical protein
MHKSIIESEERSTFLPGSIGPSSQSAASAGAVIIPLPLATKAAPVGYEEEAGETDMFESVGSLAVRLVARWTYPRCLVLVADPGPEEE